jgi:hypothetical protein
MISKTLTEKLKMRMNVKLIVVEMQPLTGLWQTMLYGEKRQEQGHHGSESDEQPLESRSM